ncbi:hypothetical protein [Limobrevibacterium gyesilva]|uniref:Lipoprotein n=1 Tax=Limobrevibacterium gyesilva TaxID=2991712 RepID=A0AA41YS53_9PROT|nr:hypothetical protein [Limobrevibacterium gyesilva]MCW3477343.1 hypothetical protein [Limobrevibacterium gyesilva]
MSAHGARSIILVSGMAVLSGCVGVDTAVMFTTDNLGVNISPTPTPTAEIGFSRQEGVIAPALENGAVIPGAASVYHSVPTFLPLATESGAVFAGGQAAAQLLTEPGGTAGDAKACISRAPTDSSGHPVITSGKARPMFFGTTTSIGFRISIPNPSGDVPFPNVHLGYKRNEAAIAPVSGKPDGCADDAAGNKYAVYVPSFLAVIRNTAGQQPGAGVQGNVNGSFNVGQVFATGIAATEAARLPAIGESFRIAAGQTAQGATGTNLQVVTVVPKQLNDRQRRAAEVVKALDQAKTDRLAALLGIPQGPGAQIEILKAIAAVTTTTQFEPLAARIKAVSGEDV